MSSKLSAAAFAIVSLLGFAGIPPASARGVVFSASEAHGPAHIEGFPREVRATIEHSARACGAPIAAWHLFSRYIQDRVTGDRLIALHYEEVHCVNKPAICTTAGCLHQVYVSKGGPYRLILTVHAPEIELKLIRGSAFEITCGETATSCIKDFRWDGSHLHPLK
jgi:hypothetical protein